MRLIAWVSASLTVSAAFSALASGDSNRNDYNQIGQQSYRARPMSTVTPSAVTPGSCGPIDLVLVVDTTGSMGGALDSVKAGLNTIVNTAQVASGNDLRLGLITFKDQVTAEHALTADLDPVKASINALTPTGGGGAAEASDEAKNTAVNNLPAGVRNDSGGQPGTQVGNFTTPYRATAQKLVILITDAPPGGFNDVHDPTDDTAMHNHALTARSKGIVVSDIFVPTAGDYDGQAAVLEDDAVTSGGLFRTVSSDGEGTGGAIDEIVALCPQPPGADGIPTLSEWAMILMAILLIGFGISKMRRGPTLRGA